MMTPEEFANAIEKLRSCDSGIYEDGYQWLQGDDLRQYLPEIARLLKLESDPIIRGRFVELVANADAADYIPLLVRELSHDSTEVRYWAYRGLSLSEHEEAKSHAARHRETHPNEDFY
jgi:hypothetical protein